MTWKSRKLCKWQTK